MMTRTAVLLAIVGIVPTSASAQASRQAATVRGVVVDSAGHPIPFALVDLATAQRTTSTSQDGQFRIDSVPAGLQVARVRAVGYSPRELTITVGPVTGWSGIIILSPMPIELPEVRAFGRYGKPPEYAYTTRYDDFFRRRRLGFGSFITREDIERRGAVHFEQLLHGIAGIRVSYGKPARGFSRLYSSISMSRCPDLNVALYWDGVRIYWRAAGMPPDEALAEYLASVLPSRVELVEVYQGVGQVPSDLDRTACAAIVIWTR